MKNYYLIFLTFLTISLSAQHTFSIVAVDTLTGEIGGAGATCADIVIDIADIQPGRGAIHTQSYVHPENQAYAKSLLEQGYQVDDIIDSLIANDAQGAPSYRQYAALDVINGVSTAAFSGDDCFDYKGHRIGDTYSIAGNILLGPQILDSMEAAFVRTEGPLCDKLMAAMQGAKVIGADTRCADEGVSSLSSYMIVSQPDDIEWDYYLELNVENVHPTDPIDALQSLLDEWKATGVQERSNEGKHLVDVFPNPTTKRKFTIDGGVKKFDKILLYDLSGRLMESVKLIDSDEVQLENSYEEGIYIYHLFDNKQNFYTGKIGLK
jgi:uncharacterized Ntn-hydrolase superfamily protein